MIDIHHHLLFDLDDGSKDIETSVAMAEMAAADGITHVVCTPHANARYPFDPAVNQEKVEQLRARLDGKITLGLGCDFHLSFDNIENALKNRTRYTINGKQYLLVEFSDLAIPPTMTDIFHEFFVAGIQPIITHPERNSIIQKNPHRLDEWIERGCLVQVTASSLTGRFGRLAESFSHNLLKQNKVHFIATDAHNLDSRPPRMKQTYNLIATQYGIKTAERLCVTNPKAAFFGEEFPLQPEPDTKDTSPAHSAKPGLWKRLFK
ncbi:MAG TPA: CpsB/CapC family capsule biosynthesis tyrosine phosphatase [Acidobacteriaceae bacterium]|nr:CpsB/CapC family capsule biosynthesis tyrosine phosphatase [Acidobacteriaceae bacterium]